jgi:Tfp pilus assembly protein PilF
MSPACIHNPVGPYKHPVTTTKGSAPVKKYLLASILLFSGFGVAVAADTAPSMPAKPKDMTLERARDAIAQKDWTSAQSILRGAVATDPNNADYHNLYAYSVRKGPNPDMSLVFKEYNAALSIDPKHKGAHEYLGEAYLMVGNVDKAREHLAQLDKICFFGCGEFNELKASISNYEAKKVAR